MDINFSCDQCGQHLVVEAAGAGLIIPCPKCGWNIKVPAPAPPAPTDAAKPAFESKPEKEKTIAMAWTPPSESSHHEIKK